MAKWCEVVKTEVDTESFWNKEMWVLTHQCGLVERRVRRRRDERYIRQAPKWIKCKNGSEAVQ